MHHKSTLTSWVTYLLSCSCTPCGPGAFTFSYPFTSPLPHFLIYLLVSFTFLYFPFLLVSSIFLLFHPFPFYQNSPTPCRRRRLNLDWKGTCVCVCVCVHMCTCVCKCLWTCDVQRVNYDLMRGYLDLIVTYFCIMIIVSRVEDRKSVLGLFNFAYELQNGKK